MGEIAINPTHNVHQKYRKMNLVNPYIFTPELTYNTFIGGIASTIGTASALAAKLVIDVSRITNFSIIGNDLKCKITGSYVIPSNCFDGDINITFYTDSDGLITDLGNNAFRATKKIQSLEFKGIINLVGSEFCGSSKISEVLMPNAISVLNLPFMNSSNVVVVYIPRCTNLGGSAANNGTLNVINTQAIVYAHPSLATNNSGAPDGDLAGRTVRYVNNTTPPNPVVSLSVGDIYNTAIKLNFTVPTESANAIDYYLVYNNGILLGKISASGQYITGLLPSTYYVITVVAVDIYYNKSVISNSVSINTTNRVAVDPDAIAYVSASSNIAYQDIIDDLFVSLKSNSIYAKIQAFYPFLGTTASQHKWNAKNPIDTNTAFRLTFVGTSIFSNNGYQLNGSSYANTYFIPSVQQSLNSNGFSFVVGTNNTPVGDCVDMGSFISGTQKSYLVARGSANKSIAGFNSVNAESAVTSQAKGIFTGTKQSSTVTDLFVNGVQVSTSAGAGTLPTVNVYIGALNLNGSVYGNSNQRIQFVAFHEGLSDTEVVMLHSILNTFEMLLGRKTW